jgi:post-segregation antitoxin (ccd killing protein)
MKVILNSYVEYKTIKRCKELGINMSAIINVALLEAVRGFK